MSESIRVPIESVKLLDDPVALAVWLYILSNGPSYPVKNELIQKRFGIGRDKTTSAFKKIKGAGLMSDDVYRNESGRIVFRSLRCHLTPDKK